MIRKTMASVLMGAALLAAEGAGGLHWTPPATWKSAGEKPMRLATYSVPATGGDSEPGECGVYYFGQGQGGGVQANLDRWIGQFHQPDGKPSKDAARIKKRTVHGLPVTEVDVSGVYSGMGGPMAATHSEKSGYRMLGAIVEGPQGNVFFKFTGPAKTVAANQASFEKLLDSVRP